MEKQESKQRFPTFPQPRRLRTITTYGIRILRARSLVIRVFGSVGERHLSVGTNDDPFREREPNGDCHSLSLDGSIGLFGNKRFALLSVEPPAYNRAHG